MKAVTDFLFLGSKITADGHCSHEIRRQLLLGRKAMTKLDSVLKSRDIILLTKVCIVKAMVFPVDMHGCGLVAEETLQMEHPGRSGCGTRRHQAAAPGCSRAS